ncbi:MAG: RsmE family RNA methyltransferase [Atribacterota bacterium]
MGRFFFHPEPQLGKIVLLSPEETHHLTVQRISPYTDILISNGKGELYRGVFQGKNKGHAFVLVVEKVEKELPPPSLCVWQSFLKSPARMEWLVEKLTEIGATEIGFFPAERSVKETVSKEKIKRLERIALSACKQSGRIWFPVIRVCTSFEEFLGFVTPKVGAVFLADPFGGENLLEFIQKRGIQPPVTLIIGPEGDLTEGEKQKLYGRGAFPISLSKKVFRSETAAIFGAAIISAFLGVDNASKHQDTWMQGKPG